MPTTPMTNRGAELLREELHRLKTVERPANSAAIGEARAHGDLSENAEYHAARERAGFIQGRISGDVGGLPGPAATRRRTRGPRAQGDSAGREGASMAAPRPQSKGGVRLERFPLDLRDAP